MKCYHDSKVPVKQVSGSEVRITFNQVEVAAPSMGDEPARTQWEGEQVIVPVGASKATIIEAIVASRYTVGAEIALSRKADYDAAKVEYLAFVAMAKQVASEVA